MAMDEELDSGDPTQDELVDIHLTQDGLQARLQCFPKHSKMCF